MVNYDSIPIIFGLGTLPSLAWLIFFLQEDEHPEPKRYIFLAFLGGAVVTFFALLLQIVLNIRLSGLEISQLSPLSLVGAAFIEEVAKFGIIYLLIARNKKIFDEPLDAMIYMITAALGFAAVENILNVAQAIDPIGIVTLRFIGSTLLHALASAFVGYYWAHGMIKKRLGSFIFFGLLVGTTLHTLFNYFIINFDQKIYATLLLVFVAFFVFADFEKIKHEEQSHEITQG